MESGAISGTILLAVFIVAMVAGVVLLFQMPLHAARTRDLLTLELQWHDAQVHAADAQSDRKSFQQKTIVTEFRRQLDHFFSLPWVQALQKRDSTFRRQREMLDSAIAVLSADPHDNGSLFRRRQWASDNALALLLQTATHDLDAGKRAVLMACMAILAALASAQIVIFKTRYRSARRHREAENTSALENAREIERMRLSRDLHDQVAQDLAAARLTSETLLDGMARVPAILRRRVRRLSESLESSAGALHQLAFDIRKAETDRDGLVVSLGRLCETFRRDSGCIVVFRASGSSLLDLRPAVEENLLNIAREALRNVVRHSKAHTAAVSLDVRDRTLLLKVSDRGIGFDYSRTCAEEPDRKCMGIIGMHERAASLGTRLDIKSAPGLGTQIQVQVDLKSGGNTRDAEKKGRPGRRS
jgi:signal transduction histidine kinase